MSSASSCCSGSWSSHQFQRRASPPPGRCRSYSAATVSKLRERAARSDTARRAEVVDGAVLAPRAPRIAHAPAVPDEEVREASPVGTWDEAHEIPLDLDRILLAAEAKPLREAPDVRVDHDALRLAELGCNDVGRLPRHARQPDQLFEP